MWSGAWNKLSSLQKSPAQQFSCLAQLVEHWPHDLEVLVLIPTGGNFWWIFFCPSLCKDLLDNLTGMSIVKNSNKLHTISKCIEVYEVLQFRLANLVNCNQIVSHVADQNCMASFVEDIHKSVSFSTLKLTFTAQNRVLLQIVSSVSILLFPLV